MKKPVKCFTAGQLESLCKALADTNEGLTGSEIGHVLAQAKIADPNPGETKWKRLYNALAARQNGDQSGDRVLSFVRNALDPVRYRGRERVFEQRRQSANVALAFYGLEYGTDGRFHICDAASTLKDAEQRANRLRAALNARGVHDDVLRFCKAELVEQNCFHAVLEATKSVGDKLRRKTGLDLDGVRLVDSALGGDNPRLRINDFATDSHRSEQRGFASLTRGLYGTFRNPAAHEPRIDWEMREEDALDLFSLASYIHRRIDSASVSPLSG